MKLNKLLVALSLTVISGSALAAAGDTATLKVTGKLIPAACTVNLDNGGIADYGDMFMGNLSATEDNQLPEKRLNLGIKCSSNQLVAYTFHDERRDSLYNGVIIDAGVAGISLTSSGNQYGLGFAKNGKTRLGAYSVANWYPDLTYTSSANNLILISNTNDSDWVLSNGVSTNGVDTIRHMTLGDPDTLMPVAFSELKMPLSIKGVLQKGNELNIDDETNLDGEATISLIYL